MSDGWKQVPNKKGKKKQQRNQRATQEQSGSSQSSGSQQQQQQQRPAGTALRHEAQQVERPPQAPGAWQRGGAPAQPGASTQGGYHQRQSQSQGHQHSGSFQQSGPPRQQQRPASAGLPYQAQQVQYPQQTAVEGQRGQQFAQSGSWRQNPSGSATSLVQPSAWGASGTQQPQQRQQQPSQQPSYPTQLQKDTVVLPLDSEQKKKEPDAQIPASQMAGMTVSTTGTLGRPITVRANMMRVLFGSNFPDTVFFYDVDIKPEKKKYLYRKAFNDGLKALFPQKTPIVAFDGKKIGISAKPLHADDQITIKILVKDDDNNDNEYQVTLKLANKLDFTWFKAKDFGLDMDDKKATSLQALNIIFHQAALKNSLPLKRSFYMKPPRPIDIGSGMDLYMGLFQSIVVGSKPYLNVDVVHKGFFREQSLFDLIEILCLAIKKPSGRNAPQPTFTVNMFWECKDMINLMIKGLRVSLYENNVKIRSRQRIEGIVGKIPAEDFFYLEKRKENISVLRYYKEEKKYSIQYPEYPCVMLGNKFKSHVPIETCWIEPGQTTEKPEVVDATKRNIIREAAVGTTGRQQKIKDMLKPVNHNDDVYLKEFGITINKEFAEVPARILNPPCIIYGSNQREMVSKGTWFVKPFKTPQSDIAKDESWTVVVIDKYLKLPAAHDLAERFMKTASDYGMRIGTPNRRSFQQIVRNRKSIQDYFTRQKGMGIKFIIVLFDGSQETYANIKQVAEKHVGILTQCIKSQTYNFKISKGDMSTILNILQKDNAKLNGINHSFVPGEQAPPFLEKCMIMGADVTHKPPGSNLPSIAAVIASHDPRTHFQYNAGMKLQQKEIIIDLQKITEIHLQIFYDKNGYWPEKIILYRDGVGDTQIQEVIDIEVIALKNAWKSKTGRAIDDLKLTVLIVQKRHHTRFFPTRREDSDDKNFNVKSGTIVDREIVNPDPKYQEFYLVSHASILGTSRPTKYKVIHTNDSLIADQLQPLTYYLCHNFSRCARSVSYPAPTYYAHLAAFRGKALIYNMDINLDDLEGEQKRKLTLHNDIKEFPMFFT